MSDHDQLWTAVAQLLRAQVSEAVWFSTFQDVTALESDASVLRVSAPNAHSRDRILSRYLPLVRDALEEIGAANQQFVVEVQVADNEPVQEWAPEPVQRDGSGHSAIVEKLAVEVCPTVLTIKAVPRYAGADLSLECWGAMEAADVLAKVLGRDVVVESAM